MSEELKVIEDFERLQSAASEGPWVAIGRTIWIGESVLIYDEGGHDENDADFIAHARNSRIAQVARKLLSENESLCRELLELRAELNAKQ
jgi:hypothetical protein